MQLNSRVTVSHNSGKTLSGKLVGMGTLIIDGAIVSTPLIELDQGFYVPSTIGSIGIYFSVVCVHPNLVKAEETPEARICSATERTCDGDCAVCVADYARGL